MTVQSISSILRQVCAIAAVVLGALTSALSSIHLPTAVSTVLIVVGGVVMAVEHYLSPNTATSSPKVVVTKENVSPPSVNG